MKNPKITLSDVAERAGMSRATASRALRGLKVHRKYQGKAEAAAAELGYVVNEAARALRSVRTMTVGMVYHELRSMLGMELLRSMASGLEEVGYSLFVSTAQGRSDLFDQLVQRFLQRRVDALVCVHGDGDGAALAGYAAAGIPVMALISKQGAYSHLPLVAPSFDDAAAQCAARLKELGHRSVASFTSGRPASPSEAFIDAAKAKRLRIVRHDGGLTPERARETVRALVGPEAPATAVVAPQADAAALHAAAIELKISIPRDLSLVAIRDYSTPAPSSAAFSTIHIDPRPVGLVGAEALKAWLVRDEALSGDRRVEAGQWIDRDTVAKARI